MPASLTSDKFAAQPYVRVPALDYPAADSSAFDDYTFRLDDMTPYNNFAIKIVMITTDTSLVPQLQNLRMVATS